MTILSKPNQPHKHLDSIDVYEVGGRERIRTSGSLATTSDFESGAFNHSATLPTIDFQALTRFLAD